MDRSRSVTKKFIYKNSILILLLFLISIIVLIPYFMEGGPNIFYLEYSFNVLLLVIIYLVSKQRVLFLSALLLFIIVSSFHTFDYITENAHPFILALIAECLFYSIGTVSVIIHMLVDKRVNITKIYSAVCAYILIAFTWAMFYTIIELAHPGSFIFSHQPDFDPTKMSLYRFYYIQFLYYSFVTLSTLGFGDITPITHQARIVSSLQAVVGQLYLSILIAHLVGIHLARIYLTYLRKNKYCREIGRRTMKKKGNR